MYEPGDRKRSVAEGRRRGVPLDNSPGQRPPSILSNQGEKYERQIRQMIKKKKEREKRYRRGKKKRKYRESVSSCDTTANRPGKRAREMKRRVESRSGKDLEATVRWWLVAPARWFVIGG